MECWQIGNTTVRNPYRLIAALKAVNHSEFLGKMVGPERQEKLALFLNKSGVVNISEATIYRGEELSSLGRKWHAALHQLGFITPRIGRESVEKTIARNYIDEKLLPFTSQTNYLSGRPFEITENGFRLIEIDNLHFQQECFLRSISALRNKTSDKKNTFSPLKLVIGIFLKLKELNKDPVIKAREMAIIVQQNLNDSNIEEVTNKLIDFRESIGKEKGKVLKNRFVENYCKVHYPELTKTNIASLRDYSDLNFRYLSATGLFIARGGYSLRLAPQKVKLAELLFNQMGDVQSEPYLLRLWKGSKLPYDDNGSTLELLIEKIKYAQSISAVLPSELPKPALRNLKKLKPEEISKWHHQLDETIDVTAEIEFAKNQRDCWEEIKKYLIHLKEKKPGLFTKDEGPVYLEWAIWRAFLAINSLESSPMDCRNFKVDQALMPVSFAAGGDADLIFEFKDYILVTEVTLSESSRQEAMEGEPVRRHIAKHLEKNKKPVFGLFIATKVDTNTYETYRHGVWYNQDEQKLDLKILPMTIEQFVDLVDSYFSTNNDFSPTIFQDIANDIFRESNYEAPKWRDEVIIPKIKDYYYSC